MKLKHAPAVYSGHRTATPSSHTTGASPPPEHKPSVVVDHGRELIVPTDLGLQPQPRMSPPRDFRSDFNTVHVESLQVVGARYGKYSSSAAEALNESCTYFVHRRVAASAIRRPPAISPNRTAVFTFMRSSHLRAVMTRYAMYRANRSILFSTCIQLLGWTVGLFFSTTTSVAVDDDLLYHEMLFNASYDFVGESICDCFVGIEPKVTLHVILDLGTFLAGIFRHYINQQLFYSHPFT